MNSYFSSECPAENTAAAEESDFFDGRWDQHEIGWVIAGVTAAVVSSLSILPKKERKVDRLFSIAVTFLEFALNHQALSKLLRAETTTTDHKNPMDACRLRRSVNLHVFDDEFADSFSFSFFTQNSRFLFLVSILPIVHLLFRRRRSLRSSRGEFSSVSK